MSHINQVSFGNQLRSATMQDFLAPQAYADKNAKTYVPASYSNYTPPEIVQDEGINFMTGLVRTAFTSAILITAAALGRKHLSSMKNLDITKTLKETEGIFNKIMYYPAKIGEYTLKKTANIKNWTIEKWNNFRKKEPKPAETEPTTPANDANVTEIPAKITEST